MGRRSRRMAEQIASRSPAPISSASRQQTSKCSISSLTCWTTFFLKESVGTSESTSAKTVAAASSRYAWLRIICISVSKYRWSISVRVRIVRVWGMARVAGPS
jgi:hypothetical protein